MRFSSLAKHQFIPERHKSMSRFMLGLRTVLAPENAQYIAAFLEKHPKVASVGTCSEAEKTFLYKMLRQYYNIFLAKVRFSRWTFEDYSVRMVGRPRSCGCERI